MKPIMLAGAIGAALLCGAPGEAQPEGAVSFPHDALEWEETGPGISYAPVHGDWRTEAHGKFVRLAPGVSAPLHTHSSPYHGLVVSGRLTNPYPDEAEPREMVAGDYWRVPAGAPHGTACVSDEPCVFYTHSDARWDVIILE